MWRMTSGVNDLYVRQKLSRNEHPDDVAPRSTSPPSSLLVQTVKHHTYIGRSVLLLPDTQNKTPRSAMTQQFVVESRTFPEHYT